jgi:hypothetical protein
MTDDWSHEETNDSLQADRRNFYKVEKWSKDGLHVEELLFAGNNLEKAKRSVSVLYKSMPRFRIPLPCDGKYGPLLSAR